MLLVVGAIEALWFGAGRPADSFVLAQLTLLAAGTGALLAVALRGAGVAVPASSVALAVLLTGAFDLASATGPPGVAGRVWLSLAGVQVGTGSWHNGYGGFTGDGEVEPTTTDGQGRWRLPGVRAGTYTVQLVGGTGARGRRFWAGPTSGARRRWRCASGRR